MHNDDPDPPNTPKTLKDVMPREMTHGGYVDSRAYRLRDEAVLREIDGTVTPWPGPQRNVYFWCILTKGLAVGWNENTAQGWSFPVVRVDEHGKLAKKKTTHRRATPA